MKIKFEVYNPTDDDWDTEEFDDFESASERLKEMLDGHEPVHQFTSIGHNAKDNEIVIEIDTF